MPSALLNLFDSPSIVSIAAQALNDAASTGEPQRFSARSGPWDTCECVRQWTAWPGTADADAYLSCGRRSQARLSADEVEDIRVTPTGGVISISRLVPLCDAVHKVAKATRSEAAAFEVDLEDARWTIAIHRKIAAGGAARFRFATRPSVERSGFDLAGELSKCDPDNPMSIAWIPLDRVRLGAHLTLCGSPYGYGAAQGVVEGCSAQFLQALAIVEQSELG